MSKLRAILIKRMVADMSEVFSVHNLLSETPEALTLIAMAKIEQAEVDVKTLILELIEEAREQTLPLGWLTKQIEDL